MSLIINPARQRSGQDQLQVRGKGVLALLDVVERAVLGREVVKAVALSFAVDKIRAGTRPIVKTEAEVKRRTAICLQLFADMTAENGYGIKRAMSMLAEGLRKTLDTIPFTPAEKKKGRKDNSARAIWRPSTLADLIVPKE